MHENSENEKIFFLNFKHSESCQKFDLIGARWQLCLRKDLGSVSLRNLDIDDEDDEPATLTFSVKITVINPQTRQEKDLLVLDKVEIRNSCSAVQLEKKHHDFYKYLNGDSYQVKITFGDPRTQVDQLAGVYVQGLILNLFKSGLVDGDVTIICKGGHVVRAHRIFLAQNPFFESLFRFKDNQSPAISDNVDLSQFEAATVKALAEFIYTGKVTEKSLESRLSLYRLANYTTTASLNDAISKLIEEEGFDMNHLLTICTAR